RLDEYLRDGQTPENSPEMAAHLTQCSICATEYQARERLKSALQKAVRNEAPAPDFQARLRQSIRPQPSGISWWMGIAAALLLAFGAWGGFLIVQQFRTSPAATIVTLAEASSPAQVAIQQIGIGDHIHCTVNRDYSRGPRSDERIQHDLGSDFADLLPLIRELAPEHTVFLGHVCNFQGRDFVHLILTRGNTPVSVTLTRKRGETFDSEHSIASHKSAVVPLYLSQIDGLSVASFETVKYLGFVISGLPRTEHQQIAASITPKLRDFALRVEGRTAQQLTQIPLSRSTFPLLFVKAGL
ncbi:MAG TPA: hypothetical protein VEF04_06810, partial [Blastocatellia bacterium]|nr:hypothetical protein [Blastocatellia bacterium]